MQRVCASEPQGPQTVRGKDGPVMYVIRRVTQTLTLSAPASHDRGDALGRKKKGTCSDTIGACCCPKYGTGTFH